MGRRRVKSALIAFGVFLVLYLVGYGLLRWRKVLVRYEYYSNFKQGPLESEIDAGQDLRTSGVGAFKNTIATPAAMLYTPLRIVEAAYWNAR